MKNITKSLVVAFGLALPLFVSAQDQSSRPSRGDRHPEGDAEGRRPVAPLFAALDVNKDGMLDATEIAQASENLRKLDKNGDGQITHDEVGPKGPKGPKGPRPPRGEKPDRGDSN